LVVIAKSAAVGRRGRSASKNRPRSKINAGQHRKIGRGRKSTQASIEKSAAVTI
jgi:hypothetical protein